MSNYAVSQTWTKPITAPEHIPHSADVVIIGGGIVGVTTAYFLAKNGIKVVLCEKGHIAGEQSGRNWGWVRKQCRDERELPMMIKSMEIWRQLESEIGENVGFNETGCIYATDSEKELEKFERWLPTARKYGLDTRMLSAKELENHVKDATADWVGALHTPSDGRAEPHKAAPAIARAAARVGATILTGTAVRGIETTTGRVTAAVTEHGIIKTDQVLCAGGAWTSMFCRSLGINLPQLKVKGTVVRTPPIDKVFDGELYGGKLGIRRREDGGYTIASENYMNHAVTPSTFRFMFKFFPALMDNFSIMRLSVGRDFFNELRTPTNWPLNLPSPFEKCRVLNPDPDQKIIASINKDFGNLFPGFRDIEFVESWAGMIETTPDVVPVIEENRKIPGFYIATGFSGHGFGIGPGAGYAIAGLMSGKDSGIDLSAFKLDRFFDGSKMILNKQV